MKGQNLTVVFLSPPSSSPLSAARILFLATTCRCRIKTNVQRGFWWGNNSLQPLSQQEPEVDFATKSLLSGQVPHIQWQTFKSEQQGHSLGIRVSLKVWRRRVKKGSGRRAGRGGSATQACKWIFFALTLIFLPPLRDDVWFRKLSLPAAVD